MSFSVITPTLDPGGWLACCVASIADQKAVTVEHIVQDGGSTDGTAKYLDSERRVKAFTERDSGMYDAINRGWRRAAGEFVVHLNADEQLLPGALRTVRECFRRNPQADVVIGGSLICGPDGQLLCYRKALRPPLSVLLTWCHPVPSCSIFFRKAGFPDRLNLYDPAFRQISDALLMIDIVRSRRPVVLLNEFTSVFLWTGENLGLCQSEAAQREYLHQMSLAPKWLRVLKPLVRTGFHIRKFIAGQYFQGSISYMIYMPDDLLSRRSFEAPSPSGVYRPARTVRPDQRDPESV